MEKRQFGRMTYEHSRHLGGAAFGEVDRLPLTKPWRLCWNLALITLILLLPMARGNRLAPWIKTHRDKFFLGCKTMERSRDGALKELNGSLKRLH